MSPKTDRLSIWFFINLLWIWDAMDLDRQELADSSKSEDCQRIINRCIQRADERGRKEPGKIWEKKHKKNEQEKSTG